MKDFMKKIIAPYDIVCEGREFDNDEDCDVWNFIQQNLLYDDIHRNLPIPVFSYV